MKAIQKINEILSAITPPANAIRGGVYLNSIKNEFITFPGRITIPKIPVQELDYDSAVGMVRDIARYVPEFLAGHTLLEKRRPASEVHSLQFVMPLKGRLMGFTHFFKIDMRFGGDSTNVIEKGDTTHYPSYNTNRVYYKSRLVPAEPGRDDEFAPLRLIDELKVESDMHFRTFAIFDEVGSREMTRELLDRLDLDVFNVSRELYPFVVFEFFTACFSVVYPSPGEIAAALELFEPLFLILHGRYRDAGGIAAPGAIVEAWPGVIELSGDSLRPTEEFTGRLRDYFRRFSVIRDDELSLKGWWKMEIAPL